MTHLADAVAQLLRQQTMRIHYLPGDPTRSYAVRAPCLLTQLADCIATSNGGRGGRTVPGSRLPLDIEAWQLWQDIHTTVYTLAENLRIDRRPYTAEIRRRREVAEREPDWMRTLRPWLAPVAWTEPVEVPTPAAGPHVPSAGPEVWVRRDVALIAWDLGANLVDMTMPPVGQLLRRVAGALAADDAAAATLSRRVWCGKEVTPADCGRCWVHRIQGILVAQVEDREVRGAACWQCTVPAADPDADPVPTSSALVEREGETYRVPAVVIRIAVLPGLDDLWVYRMCRACGAEAWLDYRTETGSSGPRPVVDQAGPDPAAARRAELRSAAVTQRRADEARWGRTDRTNRLAGVLVEVPKPTDGSLTP